MQNRVKLFVHSATRAAISALLLLVLSVPLLAQDSQGGEATPEPAAPAFPSFEGNILPDFSAQPGQTAADAAAGESLSTEGGQSTAGARNVPAPSQVPGFCSGLVFVGPNSGAGNGTQSNPYPTIGQGVTQAVAAGANRCVIVLPGSYASPVNIRNITTPVHVFSYAAVSPLPDASIILINQQAQIGNRLSAVVIANSNQVTFAGFQFALAPGANFSASFPSVITIESSQNITFSGNTITGFNRGADGLVTVKNSPTAIRIRGNAFINNVNGVDAGGTPSFENVLVVVDNSGAADSPVIVDRNRFVGNRNVTGAFSLGGLKDSGDPNADPPRPPGDVEKLLAWTPLVRTVDSYTDFVSNTFQSNRAETLVQTITRQRLGQQRARFFSNAFVNNDITTVDPIDGSGPLVNPFFTQRFYFVNNTVANNRISTQSTSGYVVGRGDQGNNDNGDINVTGSLISAEARFDVHSNLVFNNQSAGIVNDTRFPGAVECRSNQEETVIDSGAKFNWYFSNGADFGTCTAAANKPTNNNTATNPAQFLVGGSDPTAPGYYGFKTVGAAPGAKDGIDDGWDNYATANFAQYVEDARGIERRLDGDNNGTSQIEIGAFEYSPLRINAPINLTVNEDQGVPYTIEISADEYVKGEYSPLRVQVTQPPRYFGTQCGPEFTTAARGVVSKILPTNETVIQYCPPEDFHTSSAGLSAVSFGIRVIDAVGDTATGQINYTINPVNDRPMGGGIVLGDNNPAGDIILAPVGFGRADDTRARPYVTFNNNFFFSERNAVQVEARKQVDYDFSYANLEIVSDPNNVFTGRTTLNAAQGIITIDLTDLNPAGGGLPNGGKAEGQARYTVTDRNGTSQVNILTLRARIPPAPFNLLTPVDNATLIFANELNFSWQVSANALTYNFLVERVVDPTLSVPAIQRGGLTPAGDGDPLNCSADTCTYSLSDAERALFTSGSYSWTVLADNEGVTTEATNAPSSFNLDIGRELLANGSFEIAGQNNKRAEGWKAKNNTKSKRVVNKLNRPGKPDKIVALEGSAAYKFKAPQGGDKLTQNVQQPAGIAGDLLSLRAYAQSKNLQGSLKVDAVVKYANGGKEKIRLTAAGGTSTGYRPLTGDANGDITLTDQVSSMKVKIKLSRGSGNVTLDLVSLLLRERNQFQQLAPVNNAAFAGVGTLQTLSWQAVTAATSYSVNVEPGNALDAGGLTPQADGDGLICGIDNLCRLALNAGVADTLAPGTYQWTVTASSPGFNIASANAPSTFTVNAATQLLTNNSFEEGNANGKRPLGWTAKNFSGDKRRCNDPAKGTYFSYQGSCAMEFKSSTRENAKLQQQVDNIEGISIGSTLQLYAAVSGDAVPANALQIKAVVKFAGGGKAKIVAPVTAGTYQYQETLGASTPLNNPVASVKVTIKHKGKSGKLTLDSVRLLAQ